VTNRQTSRHAYPPRVRQLSVARVEDLSASMRRIVLAGDELEDSLPVPPLSVATHVKVVVPDPTSRQVVLPTLRERGLTWPDGAPPAVRDYTVRAFDAARRELTLDFVLHEHGPAGRWAIAAQPGDQLGVMGPRGYTVYPSAFPRYVLGADETALPATERWIAEAPRNAVLDVHVLVPDAAGQRDLPAHPGLRLHWLRGSSGDDLARALIGASSSDDGNTFVWAAGEATVLQQVRRHLRRTAGFTAEATDIHGYWKHGTADHHDSHERGTTR